MIEHNDILGLSEIELGEGENLPPGIHKASWGELVSKYGGNEWRKLLLEGLKAALMNLKNAGCRTVYVDGSFVTGKEIPGDFDALWETEGVDPYKLDPVLLTFDAERSTQKAKYRGEMFPLGYMPDGYGFYMLGFFQIDKETGQRKGIIVLDLEELE